MKKSPLRTKTPLVAKKAIPKKSVKPKKQKVPTITALRRKADKLFGHYVRLRDAEFIGFTWASECISCGRKNIVRWYDEDKPGWRWGKKEEIGHYVGRGNYYLRYDEINCNGQCVYCNKYKGGNAVGYKNGLDLKYGVGTAIQLQELAEQHKKDPLNREQLEQAIKMSKEYLEWCYAQETSA